MPVSCGRNTLHIGVELNDLVDVAEELRIAKNERFDFIAIPLAAKDRSIVSGKKRNIGGSLENCKKYVGDSAAESYHCEENGVGETALCVNASESSSGSLGVNWIPPPVEGGVAPLLYKFKPATPSDLVLDGNTWSSCVVGILSSWINPDKKGNVGLHDDALFHCDAFEKQLKWASYLGMCGVLLPPPSPVSVCNYARVLRNFVNSGVHTNLWVRIPMLYRKKGRAENKSEVEEVDGWDVWNKLRMLCNFSKQVEVALEFTDFPSCRYSVSRWVSEPVKIVIIPTSLFLSNPKGYPVLSKKHKEFLLLLFKHKIQMILRNSNADHHNHNDFLFSEHEEAVIKYSPQTNENGKLGGGGGGGEEEEGRDQSFKTLEFSSPSSLPFLASSKRYVNYIASLFMTIPPLTEVESFEYPYRDYLQSPLQPLQDNLESQTYETFERDPVKYVLYENAIYACLKDKLLNFHEEKKGTDLQSHHHDNKCSSSGSNDELFIPLIMVVGAGRGPLVTAALQALDRANIKKYELYAVEKNENAVITLNSRVHSDKHEGWRNVKVLGCDMRNVTINKKNDIIVSELLGSFGDNELSPECLDGIQKFLKNEGCFIPSSYTSYLEPVSTTKLWADITSHNDPKYYEIPFVVNPHAVFHLSNEGPLPCFTFNHPNRLFGLAKSLNENYSEESQEFLESETFLLAAKNCINRRFGQISYTSKCKALIHGLLGYFHCTLYNDISMSIVRDHESKGMFSWFPFFLPIKTPLNVEQNDKITVSLWRCDDQRRVWYEWAVCTPHFTTFIHNSGGKSYSMEK